jgi:hypothetical protein
MKAAIAGLLGAALLVGAAMAQPVKLFSPTQFVDDAIKKYPGIWERTKSGDVSEARHKASGLACADGYQSYILVDLTTASKTVAACAWSTPDKDNKGFSISAEPAQGHTALEYAQMTATAFKQKGISITTPPTEVMFNGCKAARFTLQNNPGSQKVVGGGVIVERKGYLWIVAFQSSDAVAKLAAQRGAAAEIDMRAYVKDMLTCGKTG